MTKYKNTQNGFIVSILLIVLLVVITYSYFTTNVSKALIISIITVLSIIILLFYKLTITIKDEMIIASFGIGLLKRKTHIKDIDFSTLEKVSFTILTGIGIRWTKRGWLWNVKVGDAIYFKTKNNKTFLVGTDDYDEIIKHIKQ